MILEVNIPDDEFGSHVIDLVEEHTERDRRVVDQRDLEYRRWWRGFDTTLSSHSAFIIGIYLIAAVLLTLVIRNCIIVDDLSRRLKKCESNSCSTCTVSPMPSEATDTGVTVGPTSAAPTVVPIPTN